eukprot:8600625-Alexandrium_andersonii.AAC.1
MGPALMPGIHMASCVTSWPRPHRVYGLCRAAVVVSCSWPMMRSYASTDVAATCATLAASSAHDQIVMPH